MPKMIEINVSASQGGGVQIVDYGKLKSDFHMSLSERWNVEDLTSEEAAEFRAERVESLQAELEPRAQQEFDDRLAQANWMGND